MCPTYISYGMTYDEYWYGESYRCKYYREAHELKQRQYDELLWMGGMYVYDTLCRVNPIFHDFVKAGTKPLPYVESPYSQSNTYKASQNKLTDAEKEKMEEQERLRARIHFDNVMRTWNKRFKNTETKDKNHTEET